MRVYNAPVYWLDWQPAWIIGGWIIAVVIRGRTMPDGVRSFGVSVTWTKRQGEA